MKNFKKITKQMKTKKLNSATNNQEVLELDHNHYKIFNCENKQIQLNGVVTPRHSLVIRNSENLSVDIPNTINHIELSNCKNIDLKFTKLISFIEITRSMNCKIESSDFVNIIQVDM